MNDNAANTLEEVKAKIEQGELKRAISIAQGVLQSHPNVPDAHRLLAYAYLGAKRTADAMRHLETARSLGTTAQNEIAFGRMLRTHRYFEGALSCFRAAVELDPHNLDAQALIAMTYESLGELELATQHGQECLTNADRQACQQPVDPLPFPDKVTEFDARRRARNVIAFSLFGRGQFYYECALASASMALAIFPEWQCRFYCGADVPASLRNSLIRLRAQVATSGSRKSMNWSGLFWRFLAFDDPDVDFVMVRDVDSPFTVRERLAVDDWLASEFPFHVIRDHRKHVEPMMAGLWGGRTGLLPPLAPMVGKFLPTAESRYCDQHFLRLHIWPLIRDITLAHDRYYTLRNSRRPPEHSTENMTHIGFGLPRE